MSNGFTKALKFILGNILFWVVAMSFYMIIRYYDVYFEQGVYTYFSFEYSFTDYILVGGIYVGIIYGFLNAIGTYFIFERTFSKMNYVLTLLLSSIYYFISYSIAQSIVLFVFDENEGTSYVMNTNFFELYTYPFFWIKIAYAIIIAVLVYVFQIAIAHVGKSNTLNLLTGKYDSPKEEKRIIMFIDMVSSTTIAEKIGNKKFMSLIQACFNDLSNAVKNNNANIEKYVGDEIILTWKNESDANNCVQFYFDFQQTLNKRKSYYEKEFGVEPKFRAGAHIGKMVIGQIGTGKMELTFLGDVVNSCARIQAKCRDLNQDIIISEELATLVNQSNFSKTNLGEMELRGKDKSVKLIGITEC